MLMDRKVDVDGSKVRYTRELIARESQFSAEHVTNLPEFEDRIGGERGGRDVTETSVEDPLLRQPELNLYRGFDRNRLVIKLVRQESPPTHGIHCRL